MHRSSMKELVGKLRIGRRTIKPKIKLAGHRPRIAGLETPKSASPVAGSRPRKPPAGTHTKPEPRFLSDAALANAEQLFGSIKSQTGGDLSEKIKDLIRLAREQGYLTFDDVHEALPETLISADGLAEVYRTLGNLEIEIIDQSDVDRAQQPRQEEADEAAKLDALDDPLRMYLSQMGKVPLLTREGEVAICRRIEDAENEVKRILYGLGFAAKEHIALAEKLISEPPKERFDRVILDKKIESRDRHLKFLRGLTKTVRELDRRVDEKYARWQEASKAAAREMLFNEFKRLDTKLQETFSKFSYKQRVIEEMVPVTQNICDKIHASLRVIGDLELERESERQQSIIKSEKQKIKALEAFARMPHEE